MHIFGTIPVLAAFSHKKKQGRLPEKGRIRTREHHPAKKSLFTKGRGQGLKRLAAKFPRAFGLVGPKRGFNRIGRIGRLSEPASALGGVYPPFIRGGKTCGFRGRGVANGFWGEGASHWRFGTGKGGHIEGQKYPGLANGQFPFRARGNVWFDSKLPAMGPAVSGWGGKGCRDGNFSTFPRTGYGRRLACTTASVCAPAHPRAKRTPPRGGTRGKIQYGGSYTISPAGYPRTLVGQIRSLFGKPNGRNRKLVTRGAHKVRILRFPREFGGAGGILPQPKKFLGPTMGNPPRWGAFRITQSFFQGKERVPDLTIRGAPLTLGKHG